MLALIVALPLAVLSACDRPDPQLCPPLAAQSLLDNWKQVGGAPSLGYLAADCLMVHARQFASSTESVPVVADAAVNACKPQITATQAAEEAWIAGDPSLRGVLTGHETDRELAEGAKQAARRFVIEARIGHCNDERPPIGYDYKTVQPNLLDWM